MYTPLGKNTKKANPTAYSMRDDLHGTISFTQKGKTFWQARAACLQFS